MNTVSRVEDWTEGLQQAAKDVTAGVLKGADTPGHLVEAVRYDDEPVYDGPYTLGARMDQELEYTAGEDDHVYEAGRVIGGGAPLVAFLGTANPVFLAPYAVTAQVDAGNYLYENVIGSGDE